MGTPETSGSLSGTWPALAAMMALSNPALAEDAPASGPAEPSAAAAGAAGMDAATLAGALRRQLANVERETDAAAATLVPLLQELAAAEIAAGEKEYAAVRLERAVDLIRDSQGFYSQSLMTPLLRLANIYMASGRYGKAIEKLRYAQHLTHRRDGVYSLEQIELIEQLARAFFAQDKSEEAAREQRFAFNLSRRVHGGESAAHVPGMMRYAAWFRLIGEDRKARRLYHRAIDRLEQVNGPDHHSLIEPLTQLAYTRSREGYYISDRESALRRADRILGGQQGVDAEDRAASKVRLGDFYTLVRRPSDAAGQYAASWDLLAADATANTDPAEIFSRPVVLNYPYSIIPETRVGMSVRERVVDVTYELTVKADGTVTDVDIVEHTGDPWLTRILRKRAFDLRYRPRIENGQPVETRNHRFTQTLRIARPPRPEQADIIRLLRLLGLRIR